MGGQIIEQYELGNKSFAFKMYRRLSRSTQMELFRDLLASERSNLAIKMLNSFKIRFENEE